MVCQTEIAQKTVGKEADYCLAVKGNQPKLHQGIEELFKKHLEDDFKHVTVCLYEAHEEVHGRKDSRWCAICRVSNDTVPKDLPDKEWWPNLKVIGITIHTCRRDGKYRNEVRNYILSKYLTGKKFRDAVRQHWAIENSLHWQLDMTFNEDQSRI